MKQVINTARNVDLIAFNVPWFMIIVLNVLKTRTNLLYLYAGNWLLLLLIIILINNYVAVKMGIMKIWNCKNAQNVISYVKHANTIIKCV